VTIDVARRRRNPERERAGAGGDSVAVDLDAGETERERGDPKKKQPWEGGKILYDPIIMECITVARWKSSRQVRSPGTGGRPNWESGFCFHFN
jgi:hypothetical protein